MPAINPNNYNIDFFQSYSFGDITDTNYLTYLFSQNLPDLPQELIDGAAGNFLSKYDEKGLEKSINYGPITNPGNLDEWLLEGNFPVDLNDIRTQTILGENEYGPKSLAYPEEFNCPELEVDETGFIQYQTSVGGNALTNLLGETLDAVGLGGLNSFLIDFPSELNEIANKRRLTELKSRIKENLINETVGRVNLDPIGLLSGQPLFGKDYKITKPSKGIPIPGLGILTDLADINLLALRGDPLPDGAFDWDQPMSDPFSTSTVDITKSLLKHTGKGTRGLLFKSLAPNKYGPRIDSDKFTRQLSRKSNKEDEPKEKLGYLAFSNSKEFKLKRKEKKRRKEDLKGLAESAKTFGADFIEDVEEKLNGVRNSRPDIPITPTEADNPSVALVTNDKLKNQGFEFEKYGEEIEYLLKDYKKGDDDGHISNWNRWVSGPRKITPGLDELSSFEGTWTKNDGTLVPGSSQGHEPGPQVWNDDLYWKERKDDLDTPKRGLLAYTQKLIDKSTNIAGTPARFIGMPNSDQNYDAKSGDRRHTQMSQGNLVKETKENKYYCRSWSVRNAYNRYHDLIRHDELWRNTQPGTIRDGKSDPSTKLGKYTTLRNPGIPKIAWEKDGLTEGDIMKAEKLNSLLVDKKHVIPYMFSIENLAWKDSPHYRKLPACEKGPFGGRLMWFPPYNISFTDNTSVNWDTTTFIGRAEPIYTYNNTERTGTLTFSIVVDHPSVLNKLKDDAFKTTKVNEEGKVETVSSTTNLETFFAGCDANTTKNIIREAYKEIIPAEETVIPKPEEVEEKEVIIDIAEQLDGLSFYFKNAVGSRHNDVTGDYPEYPEIPKASSCKESDKWANSKTSVIMGRCFDYNYEKDLLDWYDNPKLYKTGSVTMKGSCSGAVVCEEAAKGDIVQSASESESDNSNATAYASYHLLLEESDLIPEGFTQEELVEIPIYTYNSRGGEITKLSCGNGQKQIWGPDTSKDLKNLWYNIGSGQGYDKQEFCNQCLPTTGSTTTGTIISADKLGFKGSRNGYNERFFGTGDADSTPDSIPYNKSNKTPKLNLGVDKEWSFQVSTAGAGVIGQGISQLIEFLSTTPEGKGYKIIVTGNASNLGDSKYNNKLADDRALTVAAWMYDQMKKCEIDHVTTENGKVAMAVEGFEPIGLYKEAEKKYSPYKENGGVKTIAKSPRWKVSGKGEDQSSGLGNNSNLSGGGSSKSGQFIRTPSRLHPSDSENTCQLESRRVDIRLEKNEKLIKPYLDKFQKEQDRRIQGINEGLQDEFKAKKAKAKAEAESEKQAAFDLAKNFINECDYFMKIKEEDSFLYDSIKDKLRNFHPAFHSITPEGFNSRITFLQQCGRQGPSFIDPNQPQNTAFGRPPVCVLRIGDFYFTKIIIDSINFTFDPLQWDLNPEGIGVQPMLCSVDLNFKFIGGSTLQGPLSALQNAVSYNFFANTALYMPLEKILDERKDININEKRDYFYGPFAGPTEFDNAIGVGKNEESNVGDISNESDEPDESNESEEAASQGEGGNDGNTQNAIPGCLDTTLVGETDKSAALELDIQDNVSSEVWTEVKANPNDWDAYYCNDEYPSQMSNQTFWVKKTPDINKTEEEIIEETQDGTEETGQQNTTTDEGGPAFKEVSSLRYNQGETRENENGAITISGDYLNADNGVGVFASTLQDPTGGLLPQWVCGQIHPDLNNDYYVTITSDNFCLRLDGSTAAGQGGSHTAVVWDDHNAVVESTASSSDYSNAYVISSGNVPMEQVGRGLFAFNLSQYMLGGGISSFQEWAFYAGTNEYESTDLIENIEERIKKDGKAQWETTFSITLRENQASIDKRVANGGDKSPKKQHGRIECVGYITEVGLNTIKAAVGAQPQ